MSFSLSGALLVSGTDCLEKAIRTDRSWVPMAVVPLHRGNAQLVTVAVCIYLFFAMVLPVARLDRHSVPR